MNIYFIVMVAIYLLKLGIELGKHGQEKTGEYNFWTGLIGTAIGITLVYLAIKTGF